jgi:WD40 repeat protein
VATGVERLMMRRDGQSHGLPTSAPDGKSFVWMSPNETDRTHEILMSRAVDDQWKWFLYRLPWPESGPLIIQCTALSPDRRTLATCDHETTILWELATGRERARLTARSKVTTASVGFSPDSKTVATGNYDGVGQLWDAATGKELATLRGHPRSINHVAFSRDGKTLATASGDRTVKLWDVATAAEQATLSVHSGQVRSVAFSPDGKTLVSGSDDGTVRIWDIATRQELITLEGQPGGVRCVTFSPDGKALASGGATLDGQGEIFLWPPADNHCR